MKKQCIRYQVVFKNNLINSFFCWDYNLALDELNYSKDPVRVYVCSCKRNRVFGQIKDFGSTLTAAGLIRIINHYNLLGDEYK